MDANKFDTLARALTGGHSRRSALGAFVAGGVLSALGVGRETAARAAQGDACVIPGSGGTCVIAFEAIVREGPSASQSLAAGESPGRLRGYLSFTHGANGAMEDAELLLDDGRSLPVAGQAMGHGFQARIDLGQGRALVAVGVGEEDITRCLGRLDGTVTGTEIGDLGEWHAFAGMQNIPVAAGGGAQTEESGNRPVNSETGTGSQPASGSTASGGSGDNATTDEDGAQPVAATSGNRPVSEPSGTGSQSSGGSDGTGGNGSSAQGDGSSDRPVNQSSGNRPASESDDDQTTVEARQETVGAETILACPEGQTRCSNACVTTTSDVFNCGGCGAVCALDEECTDSQCVAIDIADPDPDPGNGNGDGDDAIADADATEDECEAGETRCDDTCVTLQTDINNCGVCGIGCGGGEECVGGTCTPTSTISCPEGQVRCDGICREALTNFGSEGISCPGGGGIPTECPPGRSLCNGACFPEGACQPTDCAPGWGYCYGVCRDFQSDPGYCGGCSSPCTGNAYCSGGTCSACSSSLTACGSDCVDTKTDLNNCGGCGNLCGTQCIDGQCTGVGPTPGCAPGATHCGDICIDLARDFNNCGQCGKKCVSNNWECAPPGVCRLREEYCEQEGKQSCGTYCSDLEDHYDCGACGYVCPADDYCVDGLCYYIGQDETNGSKPFPPKDRVLPPANQQTLAPANQQTLAPTDEITCAAGLEDCDGVCTDLSTDTLNCGACGDACGAGDVCQEGQCSTPGSSSDEQTLAPGDAGPQTEAEPAAIEPEPEPASSACPEGQVECAGICTDLTTDPLNCGACSVACGLDISCALGICGEPPAPIAPEDSGLAAPEDESEAPLTPPEATDGEPAPELEPEPEPALEPVPDPALEPALEPPPDPALEPAPAETESEPAP